MTRSEGCGRLRWMVTWVSLSAVTCSTLRYHEARGLRRRRCGAVSVNNSKVQTTSRDVNGLPSCHFTPSCSSKVSSVLAAFHFHDLARSGTIVLTLFCATCWSNITRLLNTGMKGTTVDAVASSWIEALGGLS